MAMGEYRHILLAVDFNSDSTSVVARAVALARQNDALLEVIHVVEYTSSMYPADIPLGEDLAMDNYLVEQAKGDMEKLLARHGLEGTPWFVELGIPKHEIVRVAREREVDLIVIGSHGRHGLQLLLGSTANAVLHLARCDVLAVRIRE
jgi:universal stress protein A